VDNSTQIRHQRLTHAGERRIYAEAVGKRIALLADDGFEHELLELAGTRLETLRRHGAVSLEWPGRQLGSLIGPVLETAGLRDIRDLVARGEIALLVLLRDPLSPHPIHA